MKILKLIGQSLIRPILWSILMLSMIVFIHRCVIIYVLDIQYWDNIRFLFSAVLQAEAIIFAAALIVAALGMRQNMKNLKRDSFCVLLLIAFFTAISALSIFMLPTLKIHILHQTKAISLILTGFIGMLIETVIFGFKYLSDPCCCGTKE